MEYPTSIHKKFKAKCSNSGDIFYPCLYNLVKNNSCCKQCGIKKVAKASVEKSKKNFINKLHLKSPHIKVLDEYVTKTTKLKCYCKKHNKYFYKAPQELLLNYGCDECHKEAMSKIMSYTNEEYIKMFNSKVMDIELLSEYKGMTKKVNLKCLKCGFEWSALADSVIRGHGCPSCNESKGEKLIRNILKNNNITFIKEFKPRWDNSYYRYDFFLPDYDILIEYDGKQHFYEFTGWKYKQSSTLEERISNDLAKNKLALKYNKKLMRISYSEYDNIKDTFMGNLKNLINNKIAYMAIGKEYKTN